MACHSSNSNDLPPVVEGHRGFRAAWPENTMAGFEAALQAGADAIELDVVLTSDGEVVVCHDPALNPDLTRGPDGAWIEAPGPLVLEHTLAEMWRFDVGRARPDGVTARRFPRQRSVDGARLPLLREVLELAADFGAVSEIELKTSPHAPDATASPERLAEAVMRVVDASVARRRVALRSFDWRGLIHAGRRWPDVPLRWLTDAETDANPAWHGAVSGRTPACLAGLAMGAVVTTWAPDHRGLTREQVDRAHELGLRVVPWTVNEAADLARLIGWGVDGVCTDDVSLARDLVAATMRGRASA